MKVCIIKLGALGDVVRTTSLIPALQRTFNAKITWITSQAAYRLLEFDPRIMPYTIDDNAVLQKQFDWVICLDDDLAACELASSLKTKKISGAYIRQAQRVYTDDLKEWFDMGILRSAETGGLAAANELKKKNARTYYEILYDGLGLEGPIERPRIFVDDVTISTSVHRHTDRKLVGLNTGAGARWKYKSWSIDQTIELARRLTTEENCEVILLGGGTEYTRNLKILDALKSEFISLVNTENDILYFSELIYDCNVVVSSDSLAMHLAVANGTPVVAFFGPTSASEIDLFGNGIKLETKLPCGRCYLPDCQVRPTCMDELSVEEVFQAVKQLLREV